MLSKFDFLLLCLLHDGTLKSYKCISLSQGKDLEEGYVRLSLLVHCNNNMLAE